MIYKTRTGQTIRGNDGQDRFLSRLYGSVFGRMLVKILIHPAISRAGGAFLNSPLSRGMIAPFIRQNKIDMSQYEETVFRSYNAFFTRKIKSQMRPADYEDAHLISPCDGKLTVYPISREGRFTIKHTDYTMRGLLKNESLAKRYDGGQALVFRLTVDDYHRYFYVDGGTKSRNISIPGVLHTVNPVANDIYPIYKENARQYSLLKSDHFKTILMMEVGALMVGKITNYHQEALVTRGQEKGRFEFGGSTVILFLEPGAAVMDGDLIRNSADGVETVVKAGEKIGELPETVR